MTTPPLKYDAACRALAEAKSFDEVRAWEDKAAAVREYGRRARNRAMELDALEIRERARHRRGELLLEMKAAGLLSTGRKKTVTNSSPNTVTLEDLDVTKRESSRDQKLAAMGGDSFERLIARCRSYMEEHPERHSFEAIAHSPAAHEAGRVTKARDLDFSPTPPWATRALIEIVLPEVGIKIDTLRQATAWEPACGEGHMAEPLAEYFGDVYASDIHDYGYAGAYVHDFLVEYEAAPQFDWIITNPPFEDRVIKFMLRALDLARVGVGMFLQLRYLEGIGRYREVFKDRPPTLVAPFAERVPLLMGQYDPDASTTTAFMWLVWVKGAQPKPPFWIPPGHRKALTRPDDVARFTSHPVIRRENFDSETGEIKREDAA